MTKEFLKNRVKELRKENGISAREMSIRLGQSENYINHIENGKIMCYYYFNILKALERKISSFIKGFSESGRLVRGGKLYKDEILFVSCPLSLYGRSRRVSPL